MNLCNLPYIYPLFNLKEKHQPIKIDVLVCNGDRKANSYPTFYPLLFLTLCTNENLRKFFIRSIAIKRKAIGANFIIIADIVNWSLADQLSHLFLAVFISHCQSLRGIAIIRSLHSVIIRQLVPITISLQLLLAYNRHK